MDCIVHGVAKPPTRLSAFHFHLVKQDTSLTCVCDVGKGVKVEGIC